MFHASFLLNKIYIALIKNKVFAIPINSIFYFPMVRNWPENVSYNGPSRNFKVLLLFKAI